MISLATVLIGCLLVTCKCEEAPKLKGHLEPFGKQGPSSGIDQVDGFLPPQEFFSKYVKASRPLLFKGAAKLSPAFSLWTDQYLKDQTPPRPVGDVFIEHNKKENRSQGYNFVHFTKFLGTYNTSNIYMVSDVPSYLQKDLVLPFPLQCSSFQNGGLDTHVMWFSSGGTSSVIHHDSYENINCLYRGRKEIVFVDSGKYPKEMRKIIDVKEGSYSSVDVDKIDLTKRPEFGKVDYQLATMEAGDCLYIPFLWVHQIRSYDPNLAVNTWWSRSSKYDLSNCKKQYDTNVTFDQVHFLTIQKQILKDADVVAQTVIFQMKLLGYETEQQLLQLLSGDKAKVKENAEFVAAVKQLFIAIDLNKDGKVNDDDLEAFKNIKKAEYMAIRQAADQYNVAAFKIREASEAAGETKDLPKLFKTSASDGDIFDEEKIWSGPPENENENENEDDNGDDNDEGPDENEQQEDEPRANDEVVSESEPKKDEL